MRFRRFATGFRARLAGVVGAATCASLGAAHLQESEPQRLAVRDNQGRLRLLSPEQTQQVLARQLLARAQQALADPPASLRRFGDVWRKYVSDSDVAQLESARGSVLSALRESQQEGRLTRALGEAVEGAESRAAELRKTAVRGAAAVPWAVSTAGTKLEPAVGGPAVTQRAALGGKLVGLYFTASWCGPCRRFSPKLVELHERARSKAPGGASPLEVVLVSWDEDAEAQRAYAKAAGMPWLAVPFENDAVRHELSLRFNVAHIPTLVIVEVSPDGRSATLVSEHGRDEVEEALAGRVPGARSGTGSWLEKVL